jgi:N-acetylated-alpha-linked acidic dipeptidase
MRPVETTMQIMSRGNTGLVAHHPPCALLLVPLLTLTSMTASAGTAQQPIPGFTTEHSPIEARYEKQFLGSADAARILAHQEYLAKSPAEEGTPGEWRRIQYIKQQLESYGLEADVWTFYPYMADSRKVRVAVEMVAPEKRSLPVKETKQPWHEDYDDVSVGFNEGTPAADITAEAVYANYGRAEDYDVLEQHGVAVKGKIVLVRYGGTQRSEKPYQAYVHGAAGLIMYSDPADDGFVRGPVYPDGPWRAPDGIQRGTVYRWTLYTGDPLTPGWAATKDAPRIPVKESDMSQIPPTTPIGYGAARPLLEHLTGPEAPKSWQGGLPLTYRLGGPGSTKIHLKIDIQYAPRAAWDVIVRIPGSEHPEDLAVIGTHPDVWAYSAGDNTSGVSSQLELARGLAQLLHEGWRPKRTLILGFFGAEERGITGSTEFTELLGPAMQHVVAFVNSDGTAGPYFNGTAVPALDPMLLDAARAVEWPGTGKSLYEAWSERGRSDTPRVGRPGGGTDYMPFLEHFGVPIISIGAGSPGGRYHCMCDDLHSLLKFSDPEMRYQAAVSRVIGLLAMRLSGADVLPFDYSAYASEVAQQLRQFDATQQKELGSSVVDLGRTIEQAQRWAEAAQSFDATARASLAQNADADRLHSLNQALMQVERALLTDRGLPGRPWYTHQIYAPQFYNGFARRDLPGLYDALYVQKDQAAAREYEASLYASLSKATAILNGAGR